MTTAIKVLVVGAVLAGIVLLVWFVAHDADSPGTSSPESTAGRRPEAVRTAPDRSAPLRERPGAAIGPERTAAREATGPKEGPIVQGTVWTRQGKPLAGATVRVYDANRNAEELPAPFAEVRTDADGVFAVFDRGSVVSYLIVVAGAPGYYTASTECPVGTRVHLHLGRPGILAGRVTRGNAAVVGVRVGVLGIDGVSFLPSERTDANGRYRLDNLQPGLYRLRIAMEGVARVQVAAGEETRADFAFEAGDFESGGLVDVAGQVTSQTDGIPIPGVEVTLEAGSVRDTVQTGPDGGFLFGLVPARHNIYTRPVPVRVGDRVYVRRGAPARTTSEQGVHYTIRYEPGVVIPGVVLGPEALPVAGVRIRIRVMTLPGYLRLVSETTDDQGRFELTGHADVPFHNQVKFTVLEDGNPRGVFLRTLELGPGCKPPDTLVLELQQGGEVSGRIQDEDGEPLAGARVTLGASDPGTGLHHYTYTAHDGRYEMKHVPVGRYVLRVAACGRPVHESPEVVDVLDGMCLTGRDVVLPAGLRLTGRVEDASGQPRPGASVLARPETPRRSGARPRAIVACMEPDGRFQFCGLAPGDYLVKVRATGMVTQEQVAPAGTRELLFRLVPKPSVQGRVRFARGGQPATGFRLSLYREWRMYPRNFRLFLDGDGKFTLQGIEEGDYELEATVEKDGVRYTGRTAFRMPASGSAPFQDIGVEPTRSLRGRVQDPDGFAVPDARIVLVREGRTLGKPLYTAETDRDGRYAVPEVEPGAYEVRARHSDWVETARRIEVAPGPIAPVDLVLERNGGSVRVRVVDEANRPVKGARIHLVRTDGTFLHPDRAKYERAYFAARRANPDLAFEAWIEAYTVTDARGELVRRFLPAGRFTVRVEAAGFEPGTAGVAIQVGVESSALLGLRRSTDG